MTTKRRNSDEDAGIIKDVMGSSTSSDEQKQFLKLALRDIGDTATDSDRQQLRKLMQASPVLKAEYGRIKRELQNYKTEEFLEMCLKVLLGSASSEEVSRVRSFKVSNPARWRQFLCIADVLQEMANAPACQKTKPEPMPERVRRHLLSELKRVRAERRSSQK